MTVLLRLSWHVCGTRVDHQLGNRLVTLFVTSGSQVKGQPARYRLRLPDRARNGHAGARHCLLRAEAAEDAVFVERAREILPAHVRDVQVIVNTPQLRRDATERGLAAQKVHDQYRIIWRGKCRAVGDEDDRDAVGGYGRLHRLPGNSVELGVADRFYVGPEAVRVFPLRRVTQLPLGAVAGEVRTHKE